MTWFQWIFCRFFGASDPNSEFPDEVGQDERITRFMFQTNHIKRDAGTMRSGALLPTRHPQSHIWETSVARIQGLQNPDIWKLGAFVGASREKAPVGRGDFLAQNASSVRLRVVSDKEAFERHAVLQGWPDDKEDQKQIALELATFTSVSYAPKV